MIHIRVRVSRKAQGWKWRARKDAPHGARMRKPPPPKTATWANAPPKHTRTPPHRPRTDRRRNFIAGWSQAEPRFPILPLFQPFFMPCRWLPAARFRGGDTDEENVQAFGENFPMAGQLKNFHNQNRRARTALPGFRGPVQKLAPWTRQGSRRDKNKMGKSLAGKNTVIQLLADGIMNLPNNITQKKLNLIREWYILYFFSSKILN